MSISDLVNQTEEISMENIVKPNNEKSKALFRIIRKGTFWYLQKKHTFWKFTFWKNISYHTYFQFCEEELQAYSEVDIYYDKNKQEIK
jgi:hypothetical protein